MSMDINIHIMADSELIRALSDIAGCMAAISIAKTNHTEVVLPEKAAETPQAPAGEPKDTKARKRYQESRKAAHRRGSEPEEGKRNQRDYIPTKPG